MKLSISLLVFGIFIVLAACYTGWWMLFMVPTQIANPVPTHDLVNELVDVVPEHANLFTAAKYISGFLLLLGLTLLITGVLQLTKLIERGRKFLTALTIFGLLITISSAFIICWGFPNEFVPRTITGNYDWLEGIYNPGVTQTYVMESAYFAALLGLATLGCSIAGLVKSKKTNHNLSKEG